MKLLDSHTELIDQLNSDTEQFFNEIAFFKGDIVFLRKVIDNYFRSITHIENIERLKGCVDQFRDMEIQLNCLLLQLNQHRSRIGYASKQESTVMNWALLKVHSNFNSKIKNFISDYLYVRTEIFSIVVDPLKEIQDLNSNMFSGHLLSPN